MRARYEELRSLAFGDIGAGYSQIGDETSDEVEISLVLNNTDADLILSFDGVTDHCFIPTYSQRVIDWRTNNKVQQKLSKFYVKHNGAAPTVGSIYVEVVV